MLTAATFEHESFVGTVSDDFKNVFPSDMASHRNWPLSALPVFALPLHVFPIGYSYVYISV